MSGKCFITEELPGEWGWVIVFFRGNRRFSVTPHHHYLWISSARRAVVRIANDMGIDLESIKVVYK